MTTKPTQTMNKAAPVSLSIGLVLLLCLSNITIANLHEEATGFIQVNCAPEIEITIDGQSVGISDERTGGLIVRDVAIGPRRLAGHRNRMLVWSDIIDVNPGRVSVVTLSDAGSADMTRHSDAQGVIIMPRSGRLRVQSLPVQSEIYIPAMQIRARKTRDVETWQQIPAGRYTIIAHAIGMTIEEEVMIYPDAATEVIFDFVTGKMTNRTENARQARMEQLQQQAEILRQKRQWVEAHRCLVEAVYLAPDHPELNAQLREAADIVRLLVEQWARDAQTQLRQEQFLEAHESISQILYVDPDHSEARRILPVVRNQLPEPDRLHSAQSPNSAQEVRRIQELWADRLAVPVDYRQRFGITLKLIPPGTFLQGSPGREEHRHSDETQRVVTISRPFYMSATEVTQSQWHRVMQTTARDQRDKVSSAWDMRGEGDDHPIYFVSWHDANAFCKELTRLERQAGHIGPDQRYRLPTEAEREYAARAGTRTAFHTGNSISAEQANYDGRSTYFNGRPGNYRRTIIPVAQFAPNTLGLFDMHGNVAEWCADGYDFYPLREQTDPTGNPDAEQRVYRGGSWNDCPWLLRSAHRSRSEPELRNLRVGFRVVLTLPNESGSTQVVDAPGPDDTANDHRPTPTSRRP